MTYEGKGVKPTDAYRRELPTLDDRDHPHNPNCGAALVARTRRIVRNHNDEPSRQLGDWK